MPSREDAHWRPSNVMAGLGRARTLAIIRALDLQLRRHGGRLYASVDPTARLDGPIELRVLGAGESRCELSLELGPQASVGRGVGIDLGTGRSTIRLGEASRVGTGTRFRLDGGEFEIGPRSGVREYSRFQVTGRLQMGHEVLIGFGCQVYCEERIELHDHAGLAHGVTLIDHDHDVDGTDTWWAHQPLAVDPVVVGANTIVSAGAKVLRGARLGSSSMVAANAVVRGGDYPERSLLAGVPARVVRTLGRERSGQ